MVYVMHESLFITDAHLIFFFFFCQKLFLWNVQNKVNVVSITYLMDLEYLGRLWLVDIYLI